jgi:hypothetical protein
MNFPDPFFSLCGKECGFSDAGQCLMAQPAMNQ